MRDINLCEDAPSACPTMDKILKSKSKSIFKLKGEWFFTAESKKEGLRVYSARLRKKIGFDMYGDKNKIFDIILKHIDEIKAIDELDLQ